MEQEEKTVSATLVEMRHSEEKILLALLNHHRKMINKNHDAARKLGRSATKGHFSELHLNLAKMHEMFIDWIRRNYQP